MDLTLLLLISRKRACSNRKSAQGEEITKENDRPPSWWRTIKKRYRIIDFKRNKFDVTAEVKTIEYDPNRSAFIALVEYTDGEKRYIIAPNGLTVGQKVQSGENAAPEVGNALPLGKIPLGTIISCIELRPEGGANIARSAGALPS